MEASACHLGGHLLASACIRFAHLRDRLKTVFRGRLPSFLASSFSEAAKGLWPHPYSVNAQTVLYRFIDTTRGKGPTGAGTNRATLPTGTDGPWWFEFEHFQSIKHFALQHGYSIGYAARLFAAILYEWSEVNAVVRAQTTIPLVTWKGKGKQITVGKDRPLHKPELDSRDMNRIPSGLVTEREPTSISKMTPMQGPNEVYQLYIPGLGYPNFQFAKYFTFLSMESITTG